MAQAEKATDSNQPAIAWIYNLDNYRKLFALSDDDLSKTMLDFPAGLSSFNAEMHALGHHVISGDPLYGSTPEQLAKKAPGLLADAVAHMDKRLSTFRDSVREQKDQFVARWQQSVDVISNDYAAGQAGGRYQAMTLPRLPFEDHHFQLALCVDLVFNSETAEQGNHLQLARELCRVAEEVRIFPLLDGAGKISDALGMVMLDLQQSNFGIEVKEIPGSLQKNGNAILRIWAQECLVEN